MKVKELRFRWLACGRTIKGRKLMFIEHLLCLSHCDMCQRDIHRCGPSPERVQGLMGQAAKSRGIINRNTKWGHQGTAVPTYSPVAAEGL